MSAVFVCSAASSTYVSIPAGPASIHLSIYMSACLRVPVSVFLSVCVSVCLSGLCVSVCVVSFSKMIIDGMFNRVSSVSHLFNVHHALLLAWLARTLAALPPAAAASCFSISEFSASHFLSRSSSKHTSLSPRAIALGL